MQGWLADRLSRFERGEGSGGFASGLLLRRLGRDEGSTFELRGVFVTLRSCRWLVYSLLGS